MAWQEVKCVIAGETLALDDDTAEAVVKIGPTGKLVVITFLHILVSSDTCANCGKAGVHLREVTRSFKVDGMLMLIERIPQISCPHCGESYFTAQTMHEIERIKRLRKSLAVKTTVPIATFLAAA
jgi:YgiT-type zinc finger domain-containing protein